MGCQVQEARCTGMAMQLSRSSAPIVTCCIPGPCEIDPCMEMLSAFIMPRINPTVPIPAQRSLYLSTCTPPIGSRLAPQSLRNHRNAIFSQLGEKPGSAVVHAVRVLGCAIQTTGTRGRISQRKHSVNPESQYREHNIHQGVVSKLRLTATC